MQKQQSKLSASTTHRYTQHDRTSELKEYINFKSQYENLLSSSKIEYVKSVYPHAILGRNLDQKVIVLDRIGVIKPNELSKVIDDETLLAYTFQRLVYLSQQVLKEREQIIWIIDLSGKIMQLASKKMYNNIEKIIANCHRYFPGMLHKLYFINTPMLFDAIWNKISENIEKHTLTKIVLLNDDIDEMLTQVDLTLLPKCIGGSRSDQILTMAGNLQQLNENENEKQQKQQKQQQQERQEPQIDLNSLKMALSGLKLGINHHPSVANTPLNTQADDQNPY